MATTEAEAFAELLRELKERSGRSYGVLAAKLHVSTSTLHRYCNGDAVPTDYASVERLARLCGANAEEMVELHRRWIIADEARRRARSTAPAQETPAAGAQVPGAPVPKTPAPKTPAPVPAKPDAPTPRPAPGPTPERPLNAAFTPTSAAPTDARAHDGTEPRAKRRRLRLTLAAVAVVAVAVPAVAYGMGGADGTDDRSAATAVSESPNPKSGDTAPPSPSPSRSDHKKTPSAAPPSAAASDTPRTDASAPASHEAGTAVPVSVTTRPYAFEDPCSQHYLIDSSPTRVPPPPTEQDAPGWVAALGGVASGSQFVELTVQGTGSDTVVLTALNVHIVKSDAPLAWTDYAMGVGCGGNVTTKAFAVNLDAARPSSVPQGGQRDFPYKVSESDPEVFYITAAAKTRDVSWYLELAWSSGPRSGTILVNDNGKPFRTSATTSDATYDYPPGGSEWEVAATG